MRNITLFAFALFYLFAASGCTTDRLSRTRMELPRPMLNPAITWGSSTVAHELANYCANAKPFEAVMSLEEYLSETNFVSVVDMHGSVTPIPIRELAFVCLQMITETDLLSPECHEGMPIRIICSCRDRGGVMRFHIIKLEDQHLASIHSLLSAWKAGYLKAELHIGTVHK